MNLTGNVIARGLWARGVFPHQCAWLLDHPLRRLILTPRRLADRLPLRPDSNVLEIGPGSGYFSAEIARRIPLGLLHLIDVQREMLTKARSKLQARGFDQVQYTVADAGAALPVTAGHVDIAVLVNVLGEVTNRSQCLRVICDALRPGGTLAVHESVPDPDRISLEELLALAHQNGFRFQRRHGIRLNYTVIFTRK